MRTFTVAEPSAQVEQDALVTFTLITRAESTITATVLVAVQLFISVPVTV